MPVSGPYPPNNAFSLAYGLGGIGTRWSRVENIYEPDDRYTSATIDPLIIPGATEYIIATDFRAEIPEDDTINGFAFTAYKIAKRGVDITDKYVFPYLREAVMETATNQAEIERPWPTDREGVYIYGGSEDKWNIEHITPSMINDREFGFAMIAASFGIGSKTDALIDFVELSVWHTTYVPPVTIYIDNGIGKFSKRKKESESSRKQDGESSVRKKLT